MFQEFDEFDDFKPVGETVKVNKEIGKVLEKELSDVEQFKEDFDDQLMLSDRPKDQLTDIVVQYIQGMGDVNQVNICSYQPENTPAPVPHTESPGGKSSFQTGGESGVPAR